MNLDRLAFNPAGLWLCPPQTFDLPQLRALELCLSESSFAPALWFCSTGRCWHRGWVERQPTLLHLGILPFWGHVQSCQLLHPHGLPEVINQSSIWSAMLKQCCPATPHLWLPFRNENHWKFYWQVLRWWMLLACLGSGILLRRDLMVEKRVRSKLIVSLS